MADPSGIHARKAALRLLDAVLRRGETLDQAFGAATQDVRRFEDKALARAISGETLRWLVDLDAAIDSATKQRLPDDAKVRTVLRMMLAQLWRLGTPPHAVIATGLPLLAGGPRRLAHGVFSTLAKQDTGLPAAPTLPADVAARWEERGGGDCSRSRRTPAARHSPCAMRARPGTGRTSSPPTVSRPAICGWRAAKISRSCPALPKVRGGCRISPPHCPRGCWAKGEGRNVLDLCAAPGGKTLQLAAAGWTVTALDMSKRRLDLMKANLLRTGMSASPGTRRCAAVGAQAPLRCDPARCAMYRDPAPPAAIPRCCTGSVRARLLKQPSCRRTCSDGRRTGSSRGGRLLYAVCSIEAEEGPAIVQECLLQPDPITPADLPAGPRSPMKNGWLRTDPGMMHEQGGLDGFFIARPARAGLTLRARRNARYPRSGPRPPARRRER